MDLWLEHSVGYESGWTVWNLDLLGFATWAETEGAVLDRLPRKLREHRDWLTRHGFHSYDPGPNLRVAELVRGTDALFERDTEPCHPTEIDLAIRLLAASREDLLATVWSLPRTAFDWDPPYRCFSSRASWRTIRAILTHVANTETHDYLPRIGYAPVLPPAVPTDSWEELLSRSRRETLLVLKDLADSADRARVSGEGWRNGWSVRKALRRLVRHELLHWKSIQRIGREYEHACSSGAGEAYPTP